LEYRDRTLQCVDCGGSFLWSAPEQFFYAGRNLREPKRCPDCRARHKADRSKQPGPRSEVTCARCGKQASVPFVPREGRPVYCDACFAASRAPGPSGPR
jgi:CxxC-x17-CxxC domain-containing protein